ncbi:ATPase [Virgisporangium aliadipatigenens]|uniref:histidine kinase n=1 Tax=Virgisporangium aliadipatigenens TaxID=741659 RepID=A0A8J3YFG4_9ACTN|nr:sensor histidine kinase [Virgisporangium aliadipatigenens]GIJ43457.1 ATPase [Virgisporangium aliadipatigenens]
MRVIGTAVRAGIGLGLGALTAAVTVVCLTLAGVVLAPALAFPRLRAAVLRMFARGATNLAGLDQARLGRFLDDPEAAGFRGYGAERAMAYLGVRWPVGLLGGLILVLSAYGAGNVAYVCWVWLAGGRPDGIEFGWLVAAYIGTFTVVLAFLAVQGLIGTVRIERKVARRFLGPTAEEALRRRIEELSVSRAEVVAAVDAERRRIERDLHDGVQQRLVALGMLLGQARRSPARSTELVTKAHDETRRIIDELREVAWRVYPTALDNLGLADALARVAENSGVPVEVSYALPDRPPPRVEAAAWFVASEAVTNATKHAAASRISISVGTEDSGAIRVSVTDDGRGGADPDGSGLTGLARRVAALDGRFDVHSPAGGPTTVTAVLPCG